MSLPCTVDISPITWTRLFTWEITGKELMLPIAQKFSFKFFNTQLSFREWLNPIEGNSFYNERKFNLSKWLWVQAVWLKFDKKFLMLTLMCQAFYHQLLILQKIKIQWQAMTLWESLLGLWKLLINLKFYCTSISKPKPQ